MRARTFAFRRHRREPADRHRRRESGRRPLTGGGSPLGSVRRARDREGRQIESGGSARDPQESDLAWRLLTIAWQLLILERQLLTIVCQLFAIAGQLFAIARQLLTVVLQLLTISRRTF